MSQWCNPMNCRCWCAIPFVCSPLKGGREGTCIFEWLCLNVTEITFFFFCEKTNKTKHLFHMRCLFFLRHSNFLWESWGVWKNYSRVFCCYNQYKLIFCCCSQIFVYSFKIFSKRNDVRDLLSFIFKWIFLYVSGSQEPDDSGIKRRNVHFASVPPSEEITISAPESYAMINAKPCRHWQE